MTERVVPACQKRHATDCRDRSSVRRWRASEVCRHTVRRANHPGAGSVPAVLGSPCIRCTWTGCWGRTTATSTPASGIRRMNCEKWPVAQRRPIRAVAQWPFARALGFVSCAIHRAWAWFLLGYTSSPLRAAPTVPPEVEQFVGCLAMTGQEAPDTNRKLLVDLFKKCLSGDGVSGPPAKARTTRVYALGCSSACKSRHCSETLSRGRARMPSVDRSCLPLHRPKVVLPSGACARTHIGHIDRHTPVPVEWPGGYAQDVNLTGSSRACSSCWGGPG